MKLMSLFGKPQEKYSETHRALLEYCYFNKLDAKFLEDPTLSLSQVMWSIALMEESIPVPNPLQSGYVMGLIHKLVDGGYDPKPLYCKGVSDEYATAYCYCVMNDIPVERDETARELFDKFEKFTGLVSGAYEDPIFYSHSNVLCDYIRDGKVYLGAKEFLPLGYSSDVARLLAVVKLNGEDGTKYISNNSTMEEAIAVLDEFKINRYL